MLHILLMILKIIGIILGVLLGTILVGLCLALFVPVHYQVKAKRVEGDENPPIEVAAKITWLLHFINVKVNYPAEVYLKVRIMLFTIFRLPPKPKKAKTSKTTRTSKKTEPSKTTRASRETEPFKQKKPSETKDALITENESPKKDIASKDDMDASKESLFEKIRRFFQKICQFFRNIRYTITGIYDRIKEIFENIEYYLGVIQSDTFKQAFALCKSELGAVFSYVKPRKLKADITIGMEDPATTGQILSYYGILYPFIGNHVTVVGDFEQKRIEGEVFIKGKIKLFTILKAGIRIYFNKDIRKLLKLFKKEEL